MMNQPSGSQELGLAIALVLIVWGLLSFVFWLSRQRVRLVIVRKPATVVTFPPAPTSYLRDVNRVPDDVTGWLGESGR